MLKIKELLKSFIEAQNQINESLKGLREDLKPKLDEIKTTSITVDRLNNYIESNIYTKDATVEAINKECDWCDSSYNIRDMYKRNGKYSKDNKIIEKYKELKSCNKVAKLFNMTEENVRQILIRNNIERIRVE